MPAPDKFSKNQHKQTPSNTQIHLPPQPAITLPHQPHATPFPQPATRPPSKQADDPLKQADHIEPLCQQIRKNYPDEQKATCLAIYADWKHLPQLPDYHADTYSPELQ